MQEPRARAPALPDDLGSRLVRAGLLTGVVDGLFSSVLSVAFYGSTVVNLFQRVAATLLGPAAFDGGAGTALIGVSMHFAVAFSWSAVFLLVFVCLPRVRAALASPAGAVTVACLYGPLVWLVMSLAVIPLFTREAPAIGVRWWVQLVGHAAFVGLPIVASFAETHVRGGTLNRPE